MLLQIPKRTAAIFAFIALAFSVIVPLSVPKAFSAPDTENLKAYEAKIDKVVSDFTAEIKNKGSYGYGVHNGRVYSPALDFIAPGFGEGREIDRLIEDSKYSIEDILGEGAFGNGMFNSHTNEDGTTTSNGSFAIFSPKKTVDEAKLKEVTTEELAKFLADSPKPGDTTKPGNDSKPGINTKPDDNTKPGDTTKPDAKPADTSKDTPKPAFSDNKPGSSATTDKDNKHASGAAVTSGEGEQTVLEKPTETVQLATTGAVALIALGVAVVLVATGAGLAVYRKKSAGKNV